VAPSRNALGKLVAGLLALVAEFESDLRSERVTDALDFLSSHGLYAGGKPPWGFTVGPDRILRPSPDAPLIHDAFHLYDSGAPMARVRRFLAGSAKEERETVTLSHASRLLRNAHYAGWIVTKTKSGVPERFEGQHEPIVARDVFNRVQERLAENRDRGYRGQKLSPFGSLARCGKCGASLVIKQTKPEDGGYAYLRCSSDGARGCGKFKAIPLEHVEIHTLAYVGALAGLIDAELKAETWTKWLGSIEETEKIREQIAQAEQARIEVRKLIRVGSYTAEEATADLAETERTLRRLRPRFEELSATEDESRQQLEQLRDLIDHGFYGRSLSQLWQTGSRDEKEAALRLILDKIEVGNEALGLHFKTGPFAHRAIPVPLKRERRSVRYKDSFNGLGLGVQATPADRSGPNADARRSESEADAGVRSIRASAKKSRQAPPARSAGRSRSPLCGALPVQG
jgi:site-specific DNA recombinase